MLKQMLLLLMRCWNVRAVVRVGGHVVVKENVPSGRSTHGNIRTLLLLLISQRTFSVAQPHADSLAYLADRLPFLFP